MLQVTADLPLASAVEALSGGSSGREGRPQDALRAVAQHQPCLTPTGPTQVPCPLSVRLPGKHCFLLGGLS